MKKLFIYIYLLLCGLELVAQGNILPPPYDEPTPSMAALDLGVLESQSQILDLSPHIGPDGGSLYISFQINKPISFTLDYCSTCDFSEYVSDIAVLNNSLMDLPQDDFPLLTKSSISIKFQRTLILDLSRTHKETNVVTTTLQNGYYTIEIDCYPDASASVNVPFGKIRIMSSTSIYQPPGEGTSFCSTDQNYIHTRTYTNDARATYLDQIQYFDGLGRLEQTVQRGITPNAADLVTYQEYDAFGRESITWLPAVITNNNGAFVNPETAKTNAISSNGNDQKPYSLPVYEASPLNRVMEQYGPGQAWHQDYTLAKGKAVRTTYLSNISGVDTLNCKMYKIEETTNDTILKLVYINNYTTGELYVTRIEDEDKNTSFEFKDKLGQIVLTRQIIRSGNSKVLYDTYHVYDDFGNLRAVLPPITSDDIRAFTAGEFRLSNSSPTMQRYCYLYKYDSHKRCIAKRLPGCEWIFYIYDNANQLIFTQDGEQRKKSSKKWMFSIPDAFGRIVLTGICQNSLSLGTEIAAVVKASWAKTTNTYKGYTITGVTLSASTDTVLTANYYDNYEFVGLNAIPDTVAISSPTKYGTMTGYGVRYTGGYKGLLTGSLTALHKPDGTISPDYLYSVMYYDNRGRVIQTKSNNHLAGGTEAEYIAYDFVGNPTKKKHVHMATNKTTQSEVYTYTYDHAGRLLTTTHQLTEGTTAKPSITLTSNSYDELGRLKTNQKHTHANLMTTYTYNVRSLTKSISSPLFTQTLYYNDVYGGGVAQYNGNISAMSWKHSDESASRGYAFTYDNLSRLLTAKYLKEGIVQTYSANTPSNPIYLTSYSYDKHGNINTLQRYGKTATSAYGLVDNLTMNYIGNQLTKVNDAIGLISITESEDFKNYSNVETEYFYNRNGAMTKDLNKGISNIQYNSLNLPRIIDVKSRMGEGRNEYLYSALGIKLQVVQRYNSTYNQSPVVGSDVILTALNQTKTTDYVGNKVYENNTLKRILIDGGYYEGGIYYFYITDHLGNIRVVADLNGKGIQKTHYYPFGSSFAESTSEGAQPYKYNGKELDKLHGLNMYDYSARHYDAAIGRFATVDPLAEKYYSISPYAYVANNPLKFIDPTGMSYGDYYDKYTGDHVYNDGIKDDKVYIRDTKTHFTGGGMFGGSVAVTTTTDTYLGQKSDIPDKTIEFIAQLEKTNDFFANKKEEYSSILKTVDRLDFFAGQVGNEKPFDIKRQSGPFHEDNAKWENGYAFFNGRLLRSDDFGNFNYGVAGKALGISDSMLELGAGLNQISNRITKNSPVGGIFSYGDDYKDNSMIKQGIKYYNQNFKK